MSQITVTILFTAFLVAYSKSALEHFSNHPGIYNYTINVINGENDENIWIEYMYNFVAKVIENTEHLFVKDALKSINVGNIRSNDCKNEEKDFEINNRLIQLIEGEFQFK